MSGLEIVARAGLKMIVIWGSLAIVTLPVMKIGIDIAYEIWKERRS